MPHPLDADWRFAPAARERLLERASAAGGPLVLLGTPTLFAHGCGQLDLRELVLVDRGRATVDAARALADGRALLRAVRADVTTDAALDALGPATAHVVVADPPWYRPEQVGFLAAAARTLRPGGALLLAASPRGTRPAAPDDRRLLVSDAALAGLDLVEEEPGLLPYTSPPFERAALRAAGVPGVPTDWRCGDLLVFRRSGRAVGVGFGAAAATGGGPEVGVGRVRVRLGPDVPGARPGLSPGVPGGVSASVSRRSPDRRAGNVVTTGNGVWVASGHGETGRVAGLVRGDRAGARVAGGEAFLAALEAERADLRCWGWG